MCGGPGIICMGAPIGGLMPPKGNRSAQLYMKSHISAFENSFGIRFEIIFLNPCFQRKVKQIYIASVNVIYF